MTNLKRLRKAAGLSQSQLAKKANIPVKTIQDYEQGYRDINGAKGIYLYQLAEELDCMMIDLLELEDL